MPHIHYPSFGFLEILLIMSSMFFAAKNGSEYIVMKYFLSREGNEKKRQIINIANIFSNTIFYALGSAFSLYSFIFSIFSFHNFDLIFYKIEIVIFLSFLVNSWLFCNAVKNNKVKFRCLIKDIGFMKRIKIIFSILLIFGSWIISSIKLINYIVFYFN